MTMAEVKEMIRKYDIFDAGSGKVGVRNVTSAKKNKQAIMAAKPEILKYFAEQKAAAAAAAAERESKIAAIDGLKEIKKAQSDWEKYNYKFDRMMEDECNDGANPPVRPASDVAALKARYPRAAAYVNAESWTYASNYVKAGAGKRALERIINGEDFSMAIADMEAEWSKHCADRVWD